MEPNTTKNRLTWRSPRSAWIWDLVMAVMMALLGTIDLSRAQWRFGAVYLLLAAAFLARAVWTARMRLTADDEGVTCRTLRTRSMRWTELARMEFRRKTIWRGETLTLHASDRRNLTIPYFADVCALAEKHAGIAVNKP